MHLTSYLNTILYTLKLINLNSTLKLRFYVKQSIKTAQRTFYVNSEAHTN